MIQKQLDKGIISFSILLPCYSTICQLSVTANTDTAQGDVNTKRRGWFKRKRREEGEGERRGYEERRWEEERR